MSVLRVNAVRVSQGGTRILNDVSFSVNSGELVGLIGPNGAGKTTLLRTMAGLLSIEQGQAEFDDIEVKVSAMPTLAKHVAYLEQAGRSSWPLAVENLVMLGRIPHFKLWQQPTKQDIASVRAAMEACEVLEFTGRRVNTLSGGEFARVMLARALATEPTILLADEPVAGLDPAHQLNVMDKLKALTQQGAGIVVVMHDLSLAARYCDRLSLLFDGRLVADGNADSVLSETNLMQYYEIIAHRASTGHGEVVVPVKRVQA